MLEIRPGRRIQVVIHEGDPANPTIFFIHGLGGRGTQWREQVRHLKAKYTLVVPDLLGHGESEKPLSDGDDLYSFSALNQDIQAIFERFSGKQNIVVGHSYGGAFSTFLAYHYPREIQKLVLISPVVCGPFKGVPFVYFLPVAFLKCLRPFLDKSFEKMAFASFDDPELLRIEKEGRNLNKIEIIKALLMGMGKIPQLDVSQLPLPSLVLGGREDKIVPPAMIENFYGRLPHHQMNILNKAGHMVHLERSTEVNGILDEFL